MQQAKSWVQLQRRSQNERLKTSEVIIIERIEIPTAVSSIQAVKGHMLRLLACRGHHSAQHSRRFAAGQVVSIVLAGGCTDAFVVRNQTSVWTLQPKRF